VQKLYKNNKSPVFVTEGQLDAISIEQLGFKAIALGGFGIDKLINVLKKY
jgi:DNA primase